jgi:hydroxyethylthiazole kinase-like uncharacterized protein yjeF
VSLPDWLDPLWEAAEMRAADKHAIEQAGVPSLDLMERAGLGLARVTARIAERREGPIRIVVGKGNNGGDGLVAARFLRDEGRTVDVLAASDPADLKGDARTNLERLPGPGPASFDAERLRESAVIVDALLGTGFEGEPRDPIASAIAAINAAAAPVVACDVPSGVNASNGEVAGEAVEADATATFHGPKIGLYVEPGKSHAGQVVTIEIGLVPSRARTGNKFESGTVVIAGGARGLTGAPAMAALAAMRTGAGYVQLVVPEPAEAVLALRLLEAMTHAAPHEDGAHTEAGADRVVELAERADELLAGRSAPTILTPHEGELGRLLGIESQAVRERRIEHARDAARRSGAIVVLKGDDTLVVPPDGPFAVSPGATPALATAGTGDVLSGIAGTLLAKGMKPFGAACAAVLAHVYAGVFAARDFGADHVVAGDVIDAIPEGMRR